MIKSLTLSTVAAVFAMAGMVAAATLDEVKARGSLACGVSDGLTGFGAHSLQCGLLVIETTAETALVGDHGEQSEIGFADRDVWRESLIVRQGQHVTAIASQSQFQK